VKYFVFGAARSGSTYLSEWLFPYLRDHLGYRRMLNEFFTMTPTHVTFECDNNKEIHLTTEARDVTVAERLAWLMASPFDYFLKHLVNNWNDAILYDHLMIDYHPIIVYRKDTWHQILSYGISRRTDIWYSAIPLDLHDLQLTYDRLYFDRMAHCLVSLFETAKLFRNKTFISYEEFIDDPYVLLNRLGLPRLEYEPHPAPLSAKINHNHESNFSNLSEVRLWYDGFMQSFAPSIDR
jgi:hypothetical protein